MVGEEVLVPTEDERGTSEGRRGPGGGGPGPLTGHFPIECEIVNLDSLDAASYVKRTGRPAPGPHQTPTEGVGGAQSLVTLTLDYPLSFPEAPLTIDVRCRALHDSSQKPSGLFLYKQTDAVTFRSQEPKQGNKVQSFHPQTIYFSPDLAGHDAEITIETYHHNDNVSKAPGKFTLKSGQ